MRTRHSTQELHLFIVAGACFICKAHTATALLANSQRSLCAKPMGARKLDSPSRGRAPGSWLAGTVLFCHFNQGGGRSAAFIFTENTSASMSRSAGQMARASCSSWISANFSASPRSMEGPSVETLG